MVPPHQRPPALYGHFGFTEGMAVKEGDCRSDMLSVCSYFENTTAGVHVTCK